MEEESQTAAQPVTSNPQGDRLLIWSGGVSHRPLSPSHLFNKHTAVIFNSQIHSGQPENASVLLPLHSLKLQKLRNFALYRGFHLLNPSFMLLFDDATAQQESFRQHRLKPLSVYSDIAYNIILFSWNHIKYSCNT